MNEATYKGFPTSHWRQTIVHNPFSSSIPAVRFPLKEDPDPAAIPVLVELLHDPDDIVRLVAIQSLQRIGPDSRIAIPHLIAALGDSSDWVRYEAREALRALGPDARDAAPELLTQLQASTDDTKAFGLARALWSISNDSETVLPVFVRTLENPSVDEYLQCDVIRTLGEMGPQAEKAIPILIRALEKHNHFAVRANAAVALGRIGPRARAAEPALKLALNDIDPWTRVSAAQAIWRIAGDSAGILPILVRQLEEDDKDGIFDFANRITVLQTLAEIGHSAKPAIPAIKRALRDAEQRMESNGSIAKDLKGAAIKALEKVGCDEDPA